jgi:hypothetical protein
VRPTGGLPEGRKSAEPAKARREGTSDPNNGPANESAVERETEPTTEVPSRSTLPTRRWVRQLQDLWSADTQLMGACQGFRGHPRSAAGKACKARPPDSTRDRVGSYSGRGAAVEFGNPPALPPPPGDGWPKRPANTRGGGGARIVVRGRERRPHGEGGSGYNLQVGDGHLVRRGEYRVWSRHAAQVVSVKTPSHRCEGHPWLRPRMESRMRGNSHVRFGAGDEETCPGNGARRFIPTLPDLSLLYRISVRPLALLVQRFRGTTRIMPPYRSCRSRYG